MCSAIHGASCHTIPPDAFVTSPRPNTGANHVEDDADVEPTANVYVTHDDVTTAASNQAHDHNSSFADKAIDNATKSMTTTGHEPRGTLDATAVYDYATHGDVRLKSEQSRLSVDLSQMYARPNKSSTKTSLLHKNSVYPKAKTTDDVISTVAETDCKTPADVSDMYTMSEKKRLKSSKRQFPAGAAVEDDVIEMHDNEVYSTGDC